MSYLAYKKVISEKVVLKLLIAIYATEIVVRHENRYEINIFDPLSACITDDYKAEIARKKNPKLYELNDKDWIKTDKEKVDFSRLPGAGLAENCRLKIDQILNLYNIDVGGQRIIYIGKTEQESFERLFPHTKLNELNGKLSINDYESLVIHFLGFSYWDEPIYSLPPSTTITKSDAITIAEAELINYFKPPENKNFVKDQGKSKWKHIELLVRKGYSNIRGLLDIEGQYTKFYTSHAGGEAKNRYEIDVDLDLYRAKKNKKRFRKPTCKLR